VPETDDKFSSAAVPSAIKRTRIGRLFMDWHNDSWIVPMKKGRRGVCLVKGISLTACRMLASSSILANHML
jgi:hypothetical protein